MHTESLSAVKPVVEKIARPQPSLISEKWDALLITKGGVLWICLLTLWLFMRGDRELNIMDLVLSEFHLGATYDSILRRKLYKTLPWDIFAIPLFIIALTYCLYISNQEIIVITFLAYAAIWHRGRQDYGVALFYQKSAGGPLSSVHQLLFRGATYLPMIAAVLFYTSYHPGEYEGSPYYALPIPEELAIAFGILSLIWVLVYFAYILAKPQVYRSEFWVMLAHVLAFASAYVFGAWSAGFILVLAIHHEVQYMYFAYATARRRNKTLKEGSLNESKFFLMFLLWPVIGFALAVLQMRAQIEWLFPFWISVLICHYWLDSRIWTRTAFQKSLDF